MLKILLVSIAGITFVAVLGLVLFIGTPYRDASRAIQSSKRAAYPELLRRAVLVAEAPADPRQTAIVQQLAKYYAEPRRKQIPRVFQEVLLAGVLRLRYSREQILAAYLAHVYLGPNIDGIEAAARVYLGKEMRDLNAAECALLAGLIRSPSRFSPVRHPEEACERRNRVLAEMLRAHVIDETTYRFAIAQPLRRAA